MSVWLASCGLAPSCTPAWDLPESDPDAQVPLDDAGTPAADASTPEPVPAPQAGDGGTDGADASAAQTERAPALAHDGGEVARDAASRDAGETSEIDASSAAPVARADCTSLKCTDGEQCVSRQGEAVCECRDGFARSGKSCVNVNECLRSDACPKPNMLCQDTEGSFTCLCRPPPNLLVDPGFEQQAGTVPSGAWGADPGATVETSQAPHAGQKHVRIVANNGWREVRQIVRVEPSTNYRLSAWVKTSENASDGWFGARSTKTEFSGARRFDVLSSYTQLTYLFNSAGETELYIRVGMWAIRGEAWFATDDWVLEKVSDPDSCP